MTTRTPPGWYPDPGHTGFGPALERWWDGEQWTDHTRTAQAAPAQHPASFPQQPGIPPQQPPQGRPKGPLIAGIVSSVVVAVALIVGGVVIATDGDGQNERAQGGPTPTASGESSPPDGSETPDGPSPAPDEGGSRMAEGVKLPLLPGWQRAPGAHGAAVNTTPYRCPLKEERCVRAGANVIVTPLDGAPETVANTDIEINATSSFHEDYYGGITSHEEVESKPVKVAGQDGYLVRWKIDNKADPDAYVQSVAFPHPDGSGQMLVLRLGFDIHEEAPPVSDMARIVAGVQEGVVVDDGTSEAV